MLTCANCNGPVTGAGHLGRAADGPAPVYCCFGCLAVGERACAAGVCDVGTGRGFAGVGFRLGVGVLVVGQSMAFGLALNLHDDVPPAARALAQWLLLAGTLLVGALLGVPLLAATARELRRGRLTVEALFLLTLAGAFGASLQAHLTGRGSIYYEVVSVLLVVYTLGKVVGARARVAALDGARAWGDRLGTCRVVDESGSRVVQVEEVRPGDVVEVYPGELIAVDGVVRDGRGLVSEAAVRGEPFPVVRQTGDRVLAGSASFDARFQIEATTAGTAREIDRLLKAVEEARDKPLSLQNRADRLGRWLLPLVAGVAVGTFAYWSFLTPAGWQTALFHAMSVLLVACPCAIGLATPVVVWSALNRLAERGVIVSGGDAIERLATVDRVMFDKTGTLTDDRFALLDIETSVTGSERAKLLGWLSLIQAQSNHPVAKPFSELPRPFAPGAEPRVAALRAVPGCGVVAELVEVGGMRHEVRIGTGEWIAADLPPQPPSLKGRGSQAKTVHVSVDGEAVAVAAVAERVRESASAALAHFARLGLPVEVLTGDAPGRAEALGLPAPRGGLLPDDKRRAVEEAKAAGGRPLFVGDGINDASALAAAHVGVALASGTDLAVSAAPVTLYGGDLAALPWAVELSRDAVRAVRRNLARAVAYNLVGVALAAGGVLHPVVAAVLMVVSSLTLVFSSSRVGCGHAAGRQPLPPTPSPKKGGGASSANEVATAASEDALVGSPSLLRGGVGVGFFAHALAFALQGVALLLLLPPLREPLPAAVTLTLFALSGVALAVAWLRMAIPHWLDMCVGMLTLGNLGMLLGWWADSGFAPLSGHACCACVQEARPWMWVGMLACANGAMRWLTKGPPPTREHAVAMYTGGNAGMVGGMIAGGWLAGQAPTPGVVATFALAFAGMTLGMLAGMLAGTWLAERLFVGLRAVGLWPRPHLPGYAYFRAK